MLPLNSRRALVQFNTGLYLLILTVVCWVKHEFSDLSYSFRLDAECMFSLSKIINPQTSCHFHCLCVVMCASFHCLCCQLCEQFYLQAFSSFAAIRLIKSIVLWICVCLCVCAHLCAFVRV